MKLGTGLFSLVAIALFLTPLAGLAKGKAAGAGPAQDQAQIERGQRDFDRDRLRDRDRLTAPSHDRDRDRIQDRTHVPDFAKLSDQDIYGNEVMTAQERNAYRKQLQKANSDERRESIEARHRYEMQVRAENQGVKLAPPGKGIYGGAIMTVQERNQYREQLRLVESDPQQRTQFLAKHQEKMQIRSKSQGIALEGMGEVEEAE